MNIIAGDLLLTRNLGGHYTNPTPGYYNHVAIVSTHNLVVEAQQPLAKVVATPLDVFVTRYPEITILRNADEDIAQQTAEVAQNSVGRDYDEYMSIRPRWLFLTADNCVSVVRRIYYIVTHIDYEWYIPDDLLLTDFFTRIIYKKDYDNFQEPEDFYAGSLTKWPYVDNI